MKKTAAILFLLMCAAARAQDAAQNGIGDVAKAANGFYGVAVNFPGGVPDAAGRIRLQPLLTPGLNQALADAAAAETRFKARVKSAPPLLEGDIFSSLFEGPTSWNVGACQGDARTERCAVALTRQAPGQKPASWTDTVLLANQGGWKVDDIFYDANFAFGNTGSLRQMLKMAKSEAP